MARPIVVLTDFGEADEFAASVRAALRAVSGHVSVADSFHGLPPFDVFGGAVALFQRVGAFPDAVHLAVVDPGVGGGRAAVAFGCASGAWLVGPDNGLLVPAAERLGGVREAYELDPARLALAGLSPTFHGRDLFAPAAAVLAVSDEGDLVGKPIDPTALARGPFTVRRRAAVPFRAAVLDVDRFGNARLDVLASGYALRPGTARSLRVGGRRASLVEARTFSEVETGELILYADSSGLLAIGARERHAASELGLAPRVTVEIDDLLEE